eukprot:2847176-Pleurochrysis_carterae.AAC.1
MARCVTNDPASHMIGPITRHSPLFDNAFILVFMDEARKLHARDARHASMADSSAVARIGPSSSGSA